MAITKIDQLKANGYELYSIIEVGLPHYVWRCDIDLEHDRNLHLSEETILKLIEVGIATRDGLSTAMGIEATMLRNVLVNLLERQALEYDQDDHLRLSNTGKKMLRNAKVRLTSTVEDQSIRHDPYTNALRWYKPEYDLDDNQLRSAGLKRIPSVPSLSKMQFEERFKEIERLVEMEGLPKDKLKDPGKREVLRVHAITAKKVYRPADLEVWHNPVTQGISWRVTRDGHEESDATSVLEQLEADGIQIIPQEDAPETGFIPESNEILHDVALSITQRSEETLLKTHGLRKALKQSIADAASTLMIISPWLNTGAIDAELTNAFQKALENKPKLKIFIGYGIEKLPENPQTPKDVRQYRGLKKLENIGNRYPGRVKLVEIGNTHEKIIVVDRSYGIIGSFNFLSFNPGNEKGPGVRREIGYKVTEASDVNELSQYVLDTLQS